MRGLLIVWAISRGLCTGKALTRRVGYRFGLWFRGGGLGGGLEDLNIK